MRHDARMGVLALSLLLSACDGLDVALGAQRVQGQFERNLNVNGFVDLSVRTGSGSIVIRTAGDNRVHVVGRISARDTAARTGAEAVRQIEQNPPVAQTGNTVEIGNTRDNPLYRDVSISYEISVPPNTGLNLQTGSGEQRVDAVNGPVRAQTGSGSITIERTGGSLHAQAGSGSIRVGGANGEIRAQTGSGSIAVTQTGAGDVTVQTGSGSVVLTLPPTAGFTLDARTGSGNITTSHAITMQGRMRRNNVQGTVRGGGQQVRVTTGSGSIEIR